ncbi:serine/threonine-protein kinase [Chromobacterium haemolyticum]|uniref:serine/threonine-protein kinase n=1 Tax=Chromobacterium TaxID=535 RepID=UPI0040568810
MLKPYSRAEISFQLRQEIGQEGANSTAHVAHDDQLDAEIVIKKVRKADLDSVDTYFEEAKILHLSGHPNVVSVHYACQDTDHIYIAMPFYRRGSLNALINSRFLTVREIVVLGCQIASGLHNIHSKRLIHFDLKPDNVLLSPRGEALISDFGLSRRLSREGRAEQDRMYYKMRPPEAYTDAQFTPAFDIYQFGLTLYRMCNGNAAFYEQFHRFGADPVAFDRDGFRFAVRNGQFPDRSIFPEHIPERLRRIVKKCIEPDIANRYSAAIEVSNELAQVDSCLDWEYSIVDRAKAWVRRDDSKEYQLTVGAAGNSEATKTMLESGRTTRITAYCKPTISSRDIRRFLGET